MITKLSYSIGVILLCLLISQSVLGQQEGYDEVIVSGQIIDGELAQPVPFAYVIIPRLGAGTVANENGHFQLALPAGDSLKISAMGYANSYFQLEPPFLNTDTSVVVPMFKMNIAIDEVVVQGGQTMNLNLPRGKQSELPAHLRSSDGFKKQPDVGNFIFNPLSSLYYFSRKEKNKRKVVWAMKQQKNWEKLQVYYNPKVITELTGISKYKMEDFIIFCNPYFDVDSTYAEIIIKDRICQAYKKFVEQQKP